MSLCGKRAAQRERRQGVQDEQEILQHAAKHGEIKSVDDAARLLQQCEKGLQEIVRNATAFRRKIDVRFDRLKSFQSDAAKCRVLYAEPEKAGSGTTLLHELGVCITLHFYFASSKVDVMHLASLEDFRTEAKKENDWNEIKNKKNKRTRKRSRFPKKRPFDASLLLCALIPYELGTSGIDRIQLCQMGRHDASGAYQVLAEVKLFPDESSEKEDGNTIPQASSDGG
ncbi:MAG: hypothetical protein CYPHOPRED_003872 [Cyphobasidiales sp. Tagirdzhanova-0007]|nr:MAG: hypothetical protein CYPHOPRED_003872 [Cyphobasidiales sp. Tagirdzhanova-0007]